MKMYLRVAEDAAFQAGKMLKKHRCAPHEIHYKGELIYI